eukprot:828766-Prorocentrum_minimum.AAC.1
MSLVCFIQPYKSSIHIQNEKNDGVGIRALRLGAAPLSKPITFVMVYFSRGNVRPSLRQMCM